MLSDEIKLNLYDPTKKYFPDFLQVNERIMNYSLKHCMEMPNSTSFPDFLYKTMRLSALIMETINSYMVYEFGFNLGSGNHFFCL